MSEVTTQYSCCISKVAVKSSYLGIAINPIMVGRSQFVLVFSSDAYQIIF